MCPSLRSKWVFVFACLVFALIGCTRHLETKDIYSPSGGFFLRIEIDESGGAAVSDVTSVYLFPSNSGASSGKLIFTVKAPRCRISVPIGADQI
jgi:hypothetical protein